MQCLNTWKAKAASVWRPLTSLQLLRAADRFCSELIGSLTTSLTRDIRRHHTHVERVVRPSIKTDRTRADVQHGRNRKRHLSTCRHKTNICQLIGREWRPNLRVLISWRNETDSSCHMIGDLIMVETDAVVICPHVADCRCFRSSCLFLFTKLSHLEPQNVCVFTCPADESTQVDQGAEHVEEASQLTERAGGHKVGRFWLDRKSQSHSQFNTFQNEEKVSVNSFDFKDFSRTFSRFSRTLHPVCVCVCDRAARLLLTSVTSSLIFYLLSFHCFFHDTQIFTCFSW